MGRRGVRAEWGIVPADVRATIDHAVGSPVVAATNLPGGFSPGPAARCELADGRFVFVKAGGRALNPDTPHLHRREARMLALLPPNHPAPRLLAVVDDGDWIAIVTEWIVGRTPEPPLAPRDVDRVLALLDRHAASAVGVDPVPIEPFAEVGEPLLGHWARLAGDPPTELDAWSRSHAERLAEIERDAAEAGSGRSLVHLDFRADNVVLSELGAQRDVVVDWPSATIGRPWIDLLCLVPSLHLDGGPPPGAVFETHRLGRESDPDAVDAVATAFAGFLTRLALEPPPPGLPTLRAFQAAQGRVVREWLAERLDLGPYPS
jgi:hypothetical protein